ncbi:MAG: hypothetical protein JNN11_02470 [Candidatus Doudnabacteria bacterium]|nr:hypothetical protein [Candidatus Doudnabacteria bacterium]
MRRLKKFGGTLEMNAHFAIDDAGSDDTGKRRDGTGTDDGTDGGTNNDQ